MFIVNVQDIFYYIEYINTKMYSVENPHNVLLSATYARVRKSPPFLRFGKYYGGIAARIEYGRDTYINSKSILLYVCIIVYVIRTYKIYPLSSFCTTRELFVRIKHFPIHLRGSLFRSIYTFTYI